MLRSDLATRGNHNPGLAPNRDKGGDRNILVQKVMYPFGGRVTWRAQLFHFHELFLPLPGAIGESTSEHGASQSVKNTARPGFPQGSIHV